MKIGRNDPCPCGSGKKYKQRGTDPAVGANIKATWECDEVPNAA
jgi:hypothetical protein